MLEIFRHRMKIARNEANMSQGELARSVGSTRSTISGYEADGKEPDYATLVKICKALDVSPDYLFGLTDERSFRSSGLSNDAVDVFRRSTESLPRDLRKSINAALVSFCDLLSVDVAARDGQRLRLYARLVSILSSQRSAVRSCVEAAGSSVDVSAMSEIMALQSELKNTVSALLDQLLQADMEAAFGPKEKAGGDTESSDAKAV